ncbi:MAG TPA: ribonucleoside-diphosphate reductase subunit alpha [Candidatus Paceibacterota bacterium]|nr:ribonucleoside-diphosphate reductase subunit alpha [Candidatus Paceibacterota bacterium]
MSLSITKHDGSREPFNADQINRSIERACRGLMDPIAMVTQIATETRLTLYDGITTKELDQATINASLQNVKDDPSYDKVATRILLKTIYREVLGDYDKDSEAELIKKHRDGFINFIKKGVEEGKLDSRMEEKFNLRELSKTLDIERDELFQYAGLSTFLNRYALKNLDQSPRETPQYFFMRVAMGLSFNENKPTEWAKKFYNKMSKFEYIGGGSTNLGAGTTHPALSNCFLMEVQDDMAHIAKSVADVMMLSKASGGLGVSVSKLRAAGSPLKSNNGVSTGPTPFAKIMDTAIRAIQRGGKKKGALCFYLENWHIDFPEFIDWKHNAGDDYMRMRTANTAAYLSDEFMKRVRKAEMWYMFDPAETADLGELYGEAFSKRYNKYVELADQGKLKMAKKMPAVELYRKMLVSLQTTGHPWQIFKDTINLRALNNNTGTIHMSNLCTEICLPQDKDNIAVCNLASLNLAVHVINKEVNWGKLEESVRLAIRQLDNLIDINVLPVAEAERADKENRAVGLGVMGFADALEKMGLAYDSQPAYDFADRIFEFISYMAIDESARLADERGAYKNFAGSEWSKGHVPFDTISKIEKERGVPVSVTLESKHKGLNWDILREKVKKGIRNATLMAIAPNANIGLIAATTPGVDPRFAQVFSRNKISGKYLDINHNLVKDLKNLGVWEKVKDLIIEYQGDISNIAEIPEHIKAVYKTSFTTSPYGFIEVVARAQKWMDQAISRNMYLRTRDIDETMKIYMSAWEKGLKSTYYLHMEPRHTAEQSTVSVNKSQKMGRVGFGGLRKSTVAAAVVEEKTTDESELLADSAPATMIVEPVVSPIKEEDMVEPVMVAKIEKNIVETDKAVRTVESVSKTPKVETSDVAPAAVTPADPIAQSKKPNVRFIGAKTCPTDPAELNQCDSCQ